MGDSNGRLPATNAMSPREGLERLARYPFQVLTWVADDGFPVSIATVAAVDPGTGTAGLVAPEGFALPADREISLTGSHIRPQPGYGYDERRHVTVWGRAEPAGGRRFLLRAEAAWGWDEAEVPFFEYSERNVPRARQYFDSLSAERGTPVRPRLSLPWLALRAGRLPFLTATIIPVVLGILVAAAHGTFDLLAAVLTVVAACFVHIGLNISNDVFDTTQGADDLNVTPTKYSGGSRVIQYGLVPLRGMAALSAACFGISVAIGLVLLATHWSLALLVCGVVGLILSIGYTAPPLRLVYRGLGEIAVALGFGPIMLVGAYVVQTNGTLAWEPLVASLPVALLVALILYVNEIPDRRGDASAGKRTLPVRFSMRTVVRLYLAAAVAAFAIIVAGVVAGVLPWPALAALAGLPLARRVYRGLLLAYDQPYVLMGFMGTNIRLHMVTGGLLIAAYALVIVAGALVPTPLYLG